MKTIRHRISKPYLLIIIAIPVCILILFNLIVTYYSKLQAEEDLKSIANSISQSIEESGEDTPKITTLMKNQIHFKAAELIIYNKYGELSKIFNQHSSFVTDEIADIAFANTKNLEEHEIVSFNYEGENYYVMTIDYKTKPNTERIVFISRGLSINDFVNTINIVLLIISAVITIIALFVSSKVTTAIAKPIENLTALVEDMKTDQIITINTKSDSIELHKLTNEINALNRRIYDYNQSQKTFLQNASHELRTPLMSIQGYADGIEMGIFENHEETAHLISDQSKKLTSLVDSLLTLSRAENFKDNQTLEPIDLSTFIVELISKYNGYAISNNIKIELDIEPNIITNANNELLTSSIGNIMSNAIRYAKTTISISLNYKESNIFITVKDDGAGIKNINNIFDKFSKGTDGNFGLGLSIAKTSVEMMNGEIKAYNDNGAVFVIIL